MNDAFKYFQDYYAMLKDDYPYTSSDGDDSTECRYTPPKSE